MMEIKENTKKEYNAPQMNVVETCTQFELLCGSQSGDACLDPEESQNG